MKVKVKITHHQAVIPQYATTGSACFDLHAVIRGVVPAGGTMECHTGLAFEIPEGHVMMLYSRSGHGFKHGIRLCNSVGVIDSDYRNSVIVKLHNDSATAFCIEPGDRIAQAMIVPFPQIEFVESETLSITERGFGGFGSTGK